MLRDHWVKFSLCLLLGSCLTAKKAERQLSRISVQQPGKLAEVCANKYPIIGKIDTVENTQYDFIEVLPDTFKWFQFDTVYFKSTDTIIKTVKLPQVTKTVTITHTLENQATIKGFQDKINQLNADLNASKDKASLYQKWFWILICICLSLFGLHVVRK